MISTHKRAREARGSASKGSNRLSTASALNKTIDRLVDVVESRSMATTIRHDPSGCSISRVINLLSTLPGVECGTDRFLLGTRLFLHCECREMFVALANPTVQLAWLRSFYDKENNHLSIGS